MSISVACSACGGRFKAADTAAGKKLKCPKCGTFFSIAGTSTTPSVPVAVDVVPPPPADEIMDVLPAAHKKCQFCGGQVKATSIECKHCGEIIDPAILKTCQYCGGQVKATSVECKHCGEIIDPTIRAARQASHSAGSPHPAPPAPHLPAVLPRAALPTKPSSPRAELPPAVPVPEGETLYVKDQEGKVNGPYPLASLQQYAREGRLLPSWQVSADQRKWMTAGKVPNLFTHLDQALSQHVPSGNRYRNLNRTEMMALFMDKFVLNNESFNDFFPWFKTVRGWWFKITLPESFVVTEVTANGTRHVKYDFSSGETSELDEKDLDKNVTKGIQKSSALFVTFCVLLVIGWAAWTLQDFSFASVPWKTVLVGIVSVVGFVLKAKKTKVFVGYELDETIKRKLAQIAAAFQTLRQSCKVWALEVQAHTGEMDWKYNAGSLFAVAKLPAAIFNRPIPNIETNIKVLGVTFDDKALYFLPEKILVIEGPNVDYVDYRNLRIDANFLEFVEPEGRLYQDSQVVAKRWKYINKDGSRDKRFNNNRELPVVRCGIIQLDATVTAIRLMTTNPQTPVRFKEKLETAKQS